MKDWRDLVAGICRQWYQGEFLTQGVPAALGQPTEDRTNWPSYERFMRAVEVDCVVGNVGSLWIWFPPGIAEDIEMHLHPISARRITVVDGGGLFKAIGPLGNSIDQQLVVGDQLTMPPNVLHTFFAGECGMLVFAEHLPYVDLLHDPLGYVSLA